MILISAVVVLAGWLNMAQASPLPAISPVLMNPDRRALVRSELGFEIHAGKTDWELNPSKSKNPFVVAVYRARERSASGIQPSLTVRVDPLDSPLSLRDYVRQWKQDYTRFGFEILESRAVRVQGNSGYMIQLATPESNKRLRQVVFIKGQAAAILTCRDHETSFKDTLKVCNQLIRNFSWLKN